MSYEIKIIDLTENSNACEKGSSIEVKPIKEDRIIGNDEQANDFVSKFDSDLKFVGLSSKWVKFFILILFLAVIQTGYKIKQLFGEFCWDNLFSISLFVIVFYLFIEMLFKEIRSYKKLKSINQVKTSNSIQEISSVLRKLELEKTNENKSNLAHWEENLNSCLSVNDVRDNFNLMVLEKIQDKQVLETITKSSINAGAIVAVSPFAVTDMLFVFTSSISMMNKISCIYGVPLGVYTRLKILNTVFKNMAVAGSAELLSELSAQLGIGFVGKFSQKIGQGFLAGMFSIRLGIRIARICRPVPFTKENDLSFKKMIGSLKKSFEDRKLVTVEKDEN